MQGNNNNDFKNSNITKVSSRFYMYGPGWSQFPYNVPRVYGGILDLYQGNFFISVSLESTTTVGLYTGILSNGQVSWARIA